MAKAETVMDAIRELANHQGNRKVIVRQAGNDDFTIKNIRTSTLESDELDEDEVAAGTAPAGESVVIIEVE